MLVTCARVPMYRTAPRKVFRRDVSLFICLAVTITNVNARTATTSSFLPCLLLEPFAHSR